MKFDLNQFKSMIASGVNNLYNNYPKIDKLNVFPVPDGDTGTNMNLTCINGYNEIEQITSGPIKDLISKFSRGLIMGARGNSGVIFSQIIKGTSVAIGNFKGASIDSEVIKDVFSKACEFAYKAVMKPVEGTILTVIRETSEFVNSYEFEEEIDLAKFFVKVCEAANKSLDSTPDLLPILKEVGVVDSGGFGLVKFFEGISYYLTNKKVIAKLKKLEENTGGNIDLNVDLEYGYCTEVIVLLEKQDASNINVDAIRNTLKGYENTSIVVVNDDDILKVHTHALIPGNVLTYLQQFGEFHSIKVENMTLQSDHQVKGGNKHVNFKEPAKKAAVRNLVNPFASIAVARSKQMATYFEEELNIDYVIDGGEKMNPSTQDFIKAIEEVDAKVVYIFPNDSNVILSAQQAKKEEKKSKVYIIESKSVVEGMSAFLNLDPVETPKNNIINLTKVMKNVTTISITKAARDATIDGVKVVEGDYFALANRKLAFSTKKIEDVIKKSLAKFVTNKSEIVTIFAGESAQHSDIVLIRKILDENHDVEYEVVETKQSIYSFIIGVE